MEQLWQLCLQQQQQQEQKQHRAEQQPLKKMEKSIFFRIAEQTMTLHIISHTNHALDSSGFICNYTTLQLREN